MSLWSKLFGRKRAAVVAQPVAPSHTSHRPAPRQPQPVDDIAQLALVGQVGGPDAPRAARLLARALSGPRQREAIDAVAGAMSHAVVPEGLRVSCAQALVARGEGAIALRFLHDVTEAAALMLKADLLHDDGQVAMAVSVIERVLARDIDTPGARERHARWRSALAPAARRTPASRDVTMAVPTVEHGPFRIVKEVARGGAGTIYEAKDDVLGRELALKVYHQASADRDQIRREAQIAVRLAGPGIVQVLDADYDRGWIALEWVPAGSLREVFARGDLRGLGSPLAFLRALAHALSRVHAQGWVHADVKPANVLVRSPAEPVLSDFGIATRQQDDSLGGSAGFLSPERLAGAPLDASDDIYGFGRIVEDALVKASIEGGRTEASLPGKVEHTDEWSAFRPLAERCMAPRQARPADGAELLALLTRETSDELSAPPCSTPPPAARSGH